MADRVPGRIETGVRNLDAILHGGLPRGSTTVVVGPPGSGKTVLTQQICFHNASPGSRALYFSTLSEPTAKMLRHLSGFSFFDAAKLRESVGFVDIGVIMRSEGLAPASALILERVQKLKPALVVIDSFKVFDELARSREESRKFGYELAVNLMAWECTTFLLGEFGPGEYETNPLFSIGDGLVAMTRREASGEQQRFLQVLKMRGTSHSVDEHPFAITDEGIQVFAPRVTIKRIPRVEPAPERPPRCRTGIAKLDALLGEGIPLGSSLLVAGVAGTGKTVLLLEFLYRGAQAGEKGIIFSFEETEERLRAAARGLGWNLDELVERGLLEIVFIPQPEIVVEAHLLMMHERIAAMGARRVAVDSLSVFLHKVRDPQIAREKTFQLASLVQNQQAVGFLATDIPYGSMQISRFGVEETVVDGIILLSASEEGLERQRYVEVYKLRNTAHLKGRHNMVIGTGGIDISPRYSTGGALDGPPPPVDTGRRLSTGVPRLDALLGGGLLERSVTLVSGSAGIGKTTLGLQFLVEGARVGERGLYVTLEEGPAQLLHAAQQLGLPLSGLVEQGRVALLYLPREQLRAAQVLSVLAEKLREQGASQLVLDGATQFELELTTSAELRGLLYNLVARFKALGVTSLLTLESKALYATNTVTDLGLSPVADNLLLLRYAQVAGQRARTLAVVKSRGSAHDLETHRFVIGAGGIQMGEPIEGSGP